MWERSRNSSESCLILDMCNFGFRIFGAAGGCADAQAGVRIRVGVDGLWGRSRNVGVRPPRGGGGKGTHTRVSACVCLASGYPVFVFSRLFYLYSFEFDIGSALPLVRWRAIRRRAILHVSIGVYQVHHPASCRVVAEKRRAAGTATAETVRIFAP